VFLVHDGEHVRVLSHFLQIRFRFEDFSIYVEAEKKSESGELQESIPIARILEKDGHCWYLTLGNYRPYMLLLLMLATSTEILS